MIHIYLGVAVKKLEKEKEVENNFVFETESRKKSKKGKVISMQRRITRRRDNIDKTNCKDG